MGYFNKLQIESIIYNETKTRVNKLKYLYDIGFSYDEVAEMGFTRKRK